jgi:hypothetical protein
VKKGIEKENVARLKELASLAKENTPDLSEGSAERIARIYTDCTGNPATAAEVRQVALRDVVGARARWSGAEPFL